MNNPIVSYYTDDYVEADRLFADQAGQLELVRTQEMLAAILPEPSARIADVGGGTGIYARWLMELGYEVELLDLTPAHVEAARVASPQLSAQVGDARDLPWGDASFDATLVMGPLYHLLDRSERLRALVEAARVTRPSGVVAVTAISLHASLLDLAVHNLLQEENIPRVREMMETGVNDGRFGFTESYMHTADAFEAELMDSGLLDVTVKGIEGPVWPVTRFRPPEGDLTPFVAAARVAESDRHVIAASCHFLGAGRAA
ncbi:MAG TPA: class I SAM-dependent methyltransferase [Actinomycetes bacterium]|nr:class I SAM-dependent methyltransferase [Actinomycetes bacterium]